VTAHPEVLVQLRKGFADAEGLNAPEGNTRPSDMARRGRSAGVLRPWHAGREASKNLGGPRRSCLWKMMVYGLQLLRHGRGNPDTEQCWNLRTIVDHGGRQAEEYCHRESLPHAARESYRA
jgi:hypothetical protein